MDVRGFSMCSRLGANAPIYLVLINTLDKNEIITYNIDINKNRGREMDKNFRTVLVWWMAIMICLLFLRFAVQMDRMRKNKEVIEKWSERSERASERSERASEARFRENEASV